MNFAREERLALCRLMEQVGPDAPTMCQGYTVADLAAHLVIRERRPDAGIGILLPFLAGYTEKVRLRVKETTPFPQLVEQVRNGPPRWTFWGIPGVDRLASTVEYFVHHEDVRRAQPGWEPRALAPAHEAQLWRLLRRTRFVLRKVPAEITFVRPDQQMRRVTTGGKQARVHGPVGELILWALGRKSVAQVKLTGEADAVNMLTERQWRF